MPFVGFLSNQSLFGFQLVLQLERGRVGSVEEDTSKRACGGRAELLVLSLSLPIVTAPPKFFLTGCS